MNKNDEAEELFAFAFILHGGNLEDAGWLVCILKVALKISSTK